MKPGQRPDVCAITGWKISGILSIPGKYGRHEETRTPDLYRVNLP